MKADRILSALGRGFISVTEAEFNYGPYGRLLLRNIEDNWWKHCVVSSKYNVYPTTRNETLNTLQYLRKINGDDLPFGLASIENIENDQRQSKVFDLSLPTICRVMRVTTFAEKSSAKDLFYRKQRERKAWWRKFSNNPSRFVVTNCEKNESRDVTDIRAQFSSEEITAETFTFGKAEHYLQECKSRQIANSYVVEHTTSLELAFLTLLCDGYAEDGDDLHIHPKLAPYKALIMADCGSSNEDLIQLAVYLNNQLRADGLNTIVSSNTKDAQVLRVPYTIVVDNESLVNGIVKVTSRLTTISDKVHITDLVRHVAACCA